MIRVPASRFAMGSSMEELIEAAELCQRHAPPQACRPHKFADEQPQHNVILSSYWLDRTEVTVRDYERCVSVRRCQPPPYHKGGLRFRQPDYPVSFVTWYDAQAYCNWRGARLPTEAEFERASRGLTRRKFPWGDLYNSRVANHGRFGIADTDSRDGYAELAPVGSYPNGRTPDGILDLAGNVAEWVFDRYSEQYPKKTLTNPVGPQSSNQSAARVTRGGHFKSAPVWLRNSARQARPAGERSSYVGFRCAKSILATNGN
jgi:formylglycine-generating enzyme required for sulfatase activity